ERAGIDPADMVVVSIMPCIAKKEECTLPGMDSAGYGQDVDLVITTREFIRLIKCLNIDTNQLEDEKFDSILGEGTGAGVIFGTSGGVMEAALRSAYYLATGKNPEPDAFSAVRTDFGAKEVSVNIEGTEVRAAVVSGLANAKALIEAIKSGKVSYDFVEIMACPGGCSGGGGQPIQSDETPTRERQAVLYNLDKRAHRRFAHENAEVQRVYEAFLQTPLSHKSHELLHCDHEAWNMPI
ncbi:MAG: iron hydrogenase small subunit, partial [Oscillospiraceae bacterium]|nr:iron hydrogenase small subunit [Oscillospiraceae bacterium]